MRQGVDASRRKADDGGAGARPTRARFVMLSLLFVATTINYVDRSNLSVAAPVLAKDLHLDHAQLGLLLSAFGWTYAFANLPGGLIVDRLGSRIAYGASLLLWSGATFLIGTVGNFAALFGLRLAVGAFEAPAFPSNNRVVTMWFPMRERATATSVFVMGQYIGTAMLSPLLFWVASTYGWRDIFFLTGGVGVLFAGVWFYLYRDPQQSRRANALELAEIEAGGALSGAAGRSRFRWSDIAQLFEHRQIWAICVGKYAIMTTLYFFLTWFPSYLVEARHLTMLKAGLFSVLPYAAATVGVFTGGTWSDWLLRRGRSLSYARKLPIVTGFVLASTIFLANFTQSNAVAIAILSFAFFAQGVSSMSWAIVSEVAPAQLIGVTGGVVNFVGNLAGIVTPIVIGLIISSTGSYAWALGFVGVAAVLGAVSYTFLLGPVHRLELREAAR